MAEIAGVALGVVPIVLEALKQYKTLCKLCRRFKQCKKGIDRLLHRLQAHQTIFEMETELLFRKALGPDITDLMIADLMDSHWQDPLIAKRVDRFLGSSKLAFMTAGQEVADTMKRFAEELEAIRPADPQSGDRSWKQELKKRFKFAFSEDKLANVAESIATRTVEYRTLRSQLCERAIYESDQNEELKSRQVSLERIVATGAAAQRIYDVLAVACQFHTKHHAQFSLRPRIIPRVSGTEIKFRMAYRHLAMNQVQGSQDALWFEVESILCSTISAIPPSIPAFSSDVRPTKRSRSPTLVTLKGTIRSCQKRVKFESSASTSGTGAMEDVSLPLQSDKVEFVMPLLPDLVGKGDFCRQVRATCHNKHQNGECIGVLENSNRWQHRLYQSIAPPSQSAAKDIVTLSALLASVPRDVGWNHGISPVQRLQLAKLLSAAVLNFHATSWMQSSWRSDDIFLYGMDSTNLELLLPELDAFVEVPVDGNSNLTKQQIPDILAPFVRNSTLFGLGVMLIELAFEKPLQEMVSTRDKGHGYASPEYHAAMRLSKEVSARMSARYGKIVEQCLFCTFGHGTELKNPSLQVAIHKDVVIELDRLATEFQQLVVI